MEGSEEKPLFTKELNENLDNDQLQISQKNLKKNLTVGVQFTEKSKFNDIETKIEKEQEDENKNEDFYMAKIFSKENQLKHNMGRGMLWKIIFTIFLLMKNIIFMNF